MFARDPKLDVTTYKVEEHKARLLQVSSLMIRPIPISAASAPAAAGSIKVEHMADYAQSPYAGIRYFESVERKLGKSETADSRGSTPRPASTMSAPARRPMSTC